MANKDYNFQYTPLTGRLPGNSFVKQTEQAINELAGIVNEGSAQVEVVTNLANQANDNSEVALEKATEALETSSRVYITLPNLDDADDYYDSQLYYFANSYSANLPVQDTGFLEVKTNDTKTAAEQVFIADTTGLMYMRHGVITSTEVGDETVYSVTWETWSSALASQDYVQQEVNTGIGAANDYTDNKASNYLPLSGGTLTGYVFGITPSVSDDSTKIATTAYVKDCIPKSVGDANIPVYTNANGEITSTGKSFADYATLASPTFTGTPKAPTARNSTNTTQIATTAFVKSVISNIVKVTETIINTTSATTYHIVASAVSGYTFLCWCGSATDGFVSYSYITDYDNPIADVWIGSSSSGDKIRVYALYIRTSW